MSNHQQQRSISIENLIDTQYKDYSMYVLEHRAIPSVIDGLKPVQRRGLWVARSYKNEWVKVAKLAGQCLSLHPHGSTSVEDAISNMAQSFTASNNVPWFQGKGAFGSKIVGPGNGIGAARYVSVKASEWFDKIFEHDIDLVTMVSNYDDTEKEPKTLLPIVPPVLLNPIQGIAVGFACDILPRKLEDVIHCQKQHLAGKGFHEPTPYFIGFLGTIEKTGPYSWKTTGTWEKRGKRLTITELPIGSTREGYIRILDSLEEKEVITSFIDECTDKFLFTVNLKEELKDEEIAERFKLTSMLNENINVISFNGKVRKMTVSDIIKEFTDFRFGFYLERYKKQFYQKKEQFEFERDLLKVIENGIFKKFPELKRDEIKSLLIEKGIKEENVSRIIQIPIYKFGKDEIDKLKESLAELKKNIELLVRLCKDENLRKDEYIKELKEI